ncbi:ROK family protein [Fulvivirgaceae bacterium PWU4]|uniref:ROK family protein n=1 Tax=Chryseosolibacter histidini TaxID=2782349 RepID=A0AAP2DJW1_9BACT|nr:ROK family protein [Chryseosolibacter histidini]MBT1696859.1 ROK family protein [Chryseosolibacter histidini]
MSKQKKNKVDEKSLWGIDLGGTKIEGIILRSAKNPEVLFRDRVPTEAEQGYDHILEQAKKLFDMMQKEAGLKPARVGIATPGVLDPKLGTMKNCNTVALNGKPLKKDLEKALDVKLEMANDADCFALAETLMGAVKEQFPEARVVFGVIMGTGVGGGIVIDGKAIIGLQGIAGEWGHNFLHESGGPCYCGKSGCVEKVISGPALERYYFSETGNKKPLKDIVALAESKVDPTAQKTMLRLIEYFGLGLSVVINILDPDVVVIGGGVGNIDLLYDRGRDAVAKYVFNNRLETRIIRPSLGDSAGVFGAAFLVNS